MQVKIPVREISTSMPRTRIQNTTVHMLVFAKKMPYTWTLKHQLGSQDCVNEGEWNCLEGRTCPILYQLIPSSFSPSLIGVTRPIWLGRGKIPPPLSCPHLKTEQTQNKQRKSLDEGFSMGLYLTAHGQGRHHPYFLSLFPSISHFFLLPYSPTRESSTLLHLKLHKLEIEKKR